MEARFKDEMPTLEEGRQYTHTKRRDVKHWRDHERNLVAADIHVRNHVDGIPRQVAVGQHRTLWVTGSPRGVKNNGKIVERHVDVRTIPAGISQHVGIILERHGQTALFGWNARTVVNEDQDRKSVV